LDFSTPYTELIVAAGKIIVLKNRTQFRGESLVYTSIIYVLGMVP
jgi:hypothetical protein